MPYFYKINGKDVLMNGRELYGILRQNLTNYNLQRLIDTPCLQDMMNNIPVSKRDWVMHSMYRLQEEANVYELLAFGVLLAHKLEFIHQAPFCIHGKLYFLDFYIPERRIAIEVDGKSHRGLCAQEYDKQRDVDFHHIGIKVYRVTNSLVYSPLNFEGFLIENGIISDGKYLFRPYQRDLTPKEKYAYKKYKKSKIKKNGKI